MKKIMIIVLTVILIVGAFQATVIGAAPNTVILWNDAELNDILLGIIDLGLIKPFNYYPGYPNFGETYKDNLSIADWNNVIYRIAGNYSIATEEESLTLMNKTGRFLPQIYKRDVLNEVLNFALDVDVDTLLDLKYSTWYESNVPFMEEIDWNGAKCIISDSYARGGGYYIINTVSQEEIGNNMIYVAYNAMDEWSNEKSENIYVVLEKKNVCGQDLIGYRYLSFTPPNEDVLLSFGNIGISSNDNDVEHDEILYKELCDSVNYGYIYPFYYSDSFGSTYMDVVNETYWANALASTLSSYAVPDNSEVVKKYLSRLIMRYTSIKVYPREEIEKVFRFKYGIDLEYMAAISPDIYLDDEYLVVNGNTEKPYWGSCNISINSIEMLSDRYIYCIYSISSQDVGDNGTIYAILERKEINGKNVYGYRELDTFPIQDSLIEIYRGAKNLSNYTASVKIDGSLVMFDSPPIVFGGRTFVPVRAVFETLGYDVNWDGSEERISISDGETTIYSWIKRQCFSRYENGFFEGEYRFDAPPIIVNERTLVPIRALCEATGCTVKWDGNTNTVEITSPRKSILTQSEVLEEFYRNKFENCAVLMKSEGYESINDDYVKVASYQSAISYRMIDIDNDGDEELIVVSNPIKYLNERCLSIWNCDDEGHIHLLVSAIGAANRISYKYFIAECMGELCLLETAGEFSSAGHISIRNAYRIKNGKIAPYCMIYYQTGNDGSALPCTINGEKQSEKYTENFLENFDDTTVILYSLLEN